jgi:hypothetical protein
MNERPERIAAQAKEDMSLVKCHHGTNLGLKCYECDQEDILQLEKDREEAKNLPIKLAILQAAATLRPTMGRIDSVIEAQKLWNTVNEVVKL